MSKDILFGVWSIILVRSLRFMNYRTSFFRSFFKNSFTEWMRGYDERFGIFAIDLNDPNRTRIPKESSKEYGKIVSARSITVDLDEIFTVQTFP